MDFGQIAREWIRALRGKRSQTGLGKRLGYTSNILYRWEAGECCPPTSVFFRLAEVCGINLKQALSRFLRRRPEWLDVVSPASTAGVGHLLEELRGTAPLAELVKRTSYSRYQVSRWLSNKTQPTLPEFLALIEALSQRLLDFVSAFIDPAQLPSLRGDWLNLVAARELAYAMPWSHAVLRALTLEAYRERAHSDAWVAEQLGLPASVVRSALEALEEHGQVVHAGERYVESAPDNVDTRSDPARAHAVKLWWLRNVEARLEAGAPGLFAYNVSAVSNADAKRIEQLQRRTYREIGRIIAESEHPECVVLYCAQLLKTNGQEL